MHATARSLIALAALLALAAAPRSPAATATPLAAAEEAYADWLDAGYAAATLAAGPLTSLEGQDRAAWERARAARRAALAALLSGQTDERLDAEDRRALAAMQKALAEPPTNPQPSTPEIARARCATSADRALDRKALSAALYGCFEHFGNHVAFEGGSVARTTALELLQELDSPARRKALFDALRPLFAEINGSGDPSSPYRRLVRAAAAEARSGTSPIAEAARTVGATPAEVERWLVAILEAWRAASPGPELEPWDYWHAQAAGVHALDARVPKARILPLCRAFYRDLGADLDALGVLHDLKVRPGKAPLAYAEFVRVGRDTPQGWRRGRARVSGNVEQGGLFILNEIVHEDGHAVHVSAIHTRPAFIGWGDDLFVEAFADVASWSVLEPAWQRRYLGRAVAAPVALRALYGNVMLDVAWGLFELRMFATPDADPNAVWTEITSRYLNIRPHPELAWWALRVQLVDLPGYMINYGLGAVLTADIRAHVRAAIGDFDAGNRRWYRYVSAELLYAGASLDTAVLLRRFLGRPVSSAALLAELGRLRGPVGRR